jgi:hypothetical protein
MLTVLVWNQRKVDGLHKTLTKRFVKVRSLYFRLTFTFVISLLHGIVLNYGIGHTLLNVKYL